MRKAVRLGHPDFGKAFPCRCVQDEREDERLARLQRYCNLGPLSRLTFENLSPYGRSPNPAHQEVFSRAAEAARRFADAPSGWIVLTGASGCGKTHLAAAITGHCIQRGQAALFMVVPDLLDHLRAAYQPDSEVGYDDLFEMVRGAPVLVLDDLGVQSSTPWAEEKMFQLINHRYVSRMPTVFTTNLDPGAFDPRIYTRLSDTELSQVYRLEPGAGSSFDDLDALRHPLLQSMRFKTFDPSLAAPDRSELDDIRKLHREALKFANEPRGWLVMAAPSGRGKTRLAASIGNFCREAGRDVLFVVVPDLLDRLRSSYNPQDPRTFDELFDRVRNVPLLILDDLGAHSGTAWAEEKLFQLINYRYNASLPTVVTTNATRRELDSRLFTRLTDLQVSTIIPIGRFNFFAAEEGARTPPSRGRTRRS